MNDTLTAPATFTNADRALLIQVANKLSVPSDVPDVAPAADMTAPAQFTLADRQLLINVATKIMTGGDDQPAVITGSGNPTAPTPELPFAATAAEQRIPLPPIELPATPEIQPVNPDAPVTFTQRDRNNIGMMWALLTSKFPMDIHD